MSSFRHFVPIALIFALAGCVMNIGRHETVDRPVQPVYCYDTLADVQCFSEPQPRDKTRLVGYEGPPPSQYPSSAVRAQVNPSAPPTVTFFVRDPEPIPEAVPAKTPQSFEPWKQTQPAAGRR